MEYKKAYRIVQRGDESEEEARLRYCKEENVTEADLERGDLVEESFPVSSIGQSLETGGEEFTACTYRRPAFCLVTWWEGTSPESGRILGSIVVHQDG